MVEDTRRRSRNSDTTSRSPSTVVAGECDVAARCRRLAGDGTVLKEPEADVAIARVGVALEPEVQDLVASDRVDVLGRVGVRDVGLAVDVGAVAALPAGCDVQGVLRARRERRTPSEVLYVPLVFVTKSRSKPEAVKFAGSASSAPAELKKFSQSKAAGG